MAGKLREKFKKKRREFFIMLKSNKCTHFVADEHKILVSFLAWNSIFGGYNESVKVDAPKRVQQKWEKSRKNIQT